VKRDVCSTILPKRAADLANDQRGIGRPQSLRRDHRCGRRPPVKEGSSTRNREPTVYIDRKHHRTGLVVVVVRTKTRGDPRPSRSPASGSCCDRTRAANSRVRDDGRSVWRQPCAKPLSMWSCCETSPLARSLLLAVGSWSAGSIRFAERTREIADSVALGPSLAIFRHGRTIGGRPV